MDGNGTYLGNIYGKYKECITNISIDIYEITINIHQYIHQTHRPNGAAAEGGACVFRVFSFVCFSIYGVKNKSGHDRSQSFGPILHVSGAKIGF